MFVKKKIFECEVNILDIRKTKSYLVAINSLLIRTKLLLVSYMPKEYGNKKYWRRLMTSPVIYNEY